MHNLACMHVHLFSGSAISITSSIYIHSCVLLCTLADLIGAVVVWFILAIFYEGLKTLREYLFYVDKQQWKKYNQCCNNPTVAYDKGMEAVGNVDTKVVETG